MGTSGVTLFSTKLTDLRSAKKEWAKRVLHAPRAEGFRSFAVASSAAPDQNVVGVGIGEKIVDDKPTGIMAVKFFVCVKYPEHELTKKTLLPKSIHGLPVDVEESGLFRRFAPAMPNPKTKIRPAQPGCSVGYQDPNMRLATSHSKSKSSS
jgi:hypothetical protein